MGGAVDLIVKRLCREIDRLDAVESQFAAIRKSARAVLDSLDSIDATRGAIRESLDLIGETTTQSLLANSGDAAAKRRLFLVGAS